MRKRIIDEKKAGHAAEEIRTWLDTESLAWAELTSEDPAQPIEAALQANAESGWRAAKAGTQSIRLLFDTPIRIGHIRLLFRETQTPRTQEFVLRWRSSTGGNLREIVRQQYNFSPPHTTEELEDYRVALDSVSELELSIVPDISGGPARASLAQLLLG